jgi:hypothetical protein
VKRWLVWAALVTSCSEESPYVVPPPAARAVALLSQLSGDVALTHQGQRAVATAGAVFEGDLLETGEDGHALLSAHGKEVELLEGSRFKVGTSLGDLTAATGEFVFEERDGGAFTTTGGSGRAPGGTRVRVDLRDGGTAFRISEGSFEFVADDGGINTVKGGQRLVLGEGIFEFDPKPAAQVRPPAISTLSLLPVGVVTLKSKAGPRQKIPPEGMVLDQSGTFAVSAGSQLRARVDGVSVQFEGASRGTLEPQAGDPKLRTALSRGGARVFLEPGQSVLLDGKKPVTLRATSRMTALVAATPLGARVEVLGGEGEATQGDGLPRKVGALDVVAASSKGLTTSRRAMGLLSVASVPGGLARVFWGRPSDVTLAVPAGEGAVQVATDSEFHNLLLDAHAAEQVVVPAPLKGTLYWRRGNQEASSVRFDKDETASSVAPKSDTVAETGLKATVFFQSAVPSLTFTFPSREAPGGWRFRVYAAGDLKTALVDRKVNENRAVVESGVLHEGSYLWSAVALERSGAEAAGSRMNKMDVVFDNSVTRLVLSAPREGERGSTAVGVAPLGSKLSLNGRAVGLDAGGRFSVPIGGASTLVFRLVNKDGAESLWVRRLAR